MKSCTVAFGLIVHCLIVSSSPHERIQQSLIELKTVQAEILDNLITKLSRIEENTKSVSKFLLLTLTIRFINTRWFFLLSLITMNRLTTSVVVLSLEKKESLLSTWQLLCSLKRILRASGPFAFHPSTGLSFTSNLII